MTNDFYDARFDPYTDDGEPPDDHAVYVFTDRPDLPPLPDMRSNGDGLVWDIPGPQSKVDWDQLVRLGYATIHPTCHTCHGKGHL